MKSLKYELNQAIKRSGYLTVDQVNDLTEELGYKRSNAERRLRKSESPFIRTVTNSKHYIIGYKYVGLNETNEIPEKPKLVFGNSSTIYAIRHKKW
jgi:hypothetical protein